MSPFLQLCAHSSSKVLQQGVFGKRGVFSFEGFLILSQDARGVVSRGGYFLQNFNKTYNRSTAIKSWLPASGCRMLDLPGAQATSGRPRRSTSANRHLLEALWLQNILGRMLWFPQFCEQNASKVLQRGGSEGCGF